MKVVLILAFAATAWSTGARADPLHVVATIKPVHSLVSAVMGDLGAPELIVRGGASPHTYSLRPSDAHALEQADVVFWTGHGMELFLEGSLDSLAAGATVIELADSPNIELLAIREGGTFDPHEDDDHDHQDESADAHVDEGETDMHFWLDPANGARMLEQIASTLAALDPDNAAAYAANATAEIGRLDELTEELESRLAPVRGVPFIVFHDAYQYFERRFGLTIAGSITVTPDAMPGAARVAEIRGKLAEAGAACVFSEPQFEPAIIEAIVENTGARTGVLDPEGSSLKEGPDLYPTLLRNLADSLVDCLSAAAP